MRIALEFRDRRERQRTRKKKKEREPVLGAHPSSQPGARGRRGEWNLKARRKSGAAAEERRKEVCLRFDLLRRFIISQGRKRRPRPQPAAPPPPSPLTTPQQRTLSLSLSVPTVDLRWLCCSSNFMEAAIMDSCRPSL